ncbi:MAG: RNA polymerase sigma factor [Gemmatimonadales bacterium]
MGDAFAGHFGGHQGAQTERQLIRLAAEGDARAIRALYDRYAPRVYAVVRRIAADDDLAQDYAQEAWIRAIRALPTFRGDARFSTWLHRIAVNAALQSLRKSDTRTKREAPVTEELPVAPEHADSLLQKRLQRALDQLPEGMREVLILHDVEGYTHEEIGDVLGVTSGTSKSQLFKARAKMRALLSGLSGDAREDGAEAWSI